MPLLDIGYTFKVDITTRTPVAAPTKPKQTCEDMAKPKSEPPKGDDTDIETIPRLIDPYYHNVDYFSRDNLYYCMCLVSSIRYPVSCLAVFTQHTKSSRLLCCTHHQPYLFNPFTLVPHSLPPSFNSPLRPPPSSLLLPFTCLHYFTTSPSHINYN